MSDDHRSDDRPTRDGVRGPSDESAATDPTVRLLTVGIPVVLGVVGLILIALLFFADRRPVDVGPRSGAGQVGSEPAGGAAPMTQPSRPERPAPGTSTEAAPGQTAQAGQPTRPGQTAQVAQPTTAQTSGGQAAPSGTGSWPRFRNTNFNAESTQNVGLARSWPQGGPRQVWSVRMLGPGHAGAAIHRGRVFVLDYDTGQRQDVLRCLSLADGDEFWRMSYPVEIKDNHGISRTVPAVSDDYVVTLGPMGHVTCTRTDTGQRVWQIDTVKTYGTKIPGWYAGQCPLIDGNRAIIAPGGSALMIAVDLASGQVVWQTPNPDNWGMTHSSIIPMQLGGTRTYVYAATGGVVGVSPSDGALLWSFPGWKVNTANVPSPVSVGDNRVFLTGGYGAGSMMLRVSGGSASQVWKIPQNVFGSHQHTPIFYQNHLFGVAMDKQFVCLNLDGQRVWSSGHTATFGIGPYILAEGMFYILGDDGTLVLAEANTSGWKELARARVLPGPDAWAPMALADGMLVCRDRETMVCLDVKTP